ncbi:MAG: anthranilate synthase component I family protein, partial [Polyangiales bacterium]
MKRLLVVDDLTPVAAYATLRARSEGAPSFLLESAPTAGERWGRYSVIGWRPRRAVLLDLVSLPGGERQVRLSIVDLATKTPTKTQLAPCREAMALLRAHAVSASTIPDDPDVPRVVGAAVGFVAYDLVHALEPVPSWPGERRLAHLLDGATVVVFDALLQTVSIHGEDAAAIEATVDALEGARPRLRMFDAPRRDVRPDAQTSIDDEAYARMVERAQEYIRAGDIFQVVLARTFRVPRDAADPFDAYRALRVLNPSPYLYYLDLPTSAADEQPHGPRAIAGASPETLVRLEDGRITVRPLAGTRPRDADPERDRALENELLADPKERAEHVMLVDLGRNDVGRVAAIGTVEVPVQMAIERYSHVMHIVSEVHGTLAKGRDAWDVLAATFPAGTLSGAPKVRAMQIIRELEARPRGIYGGAIGYVATTSDLDFAIAIRTMVQKGDT